MLFLPTLWVGWIVGPSDRSPLQVRKCSLQIRDRPLRKMAHTCTGLWTVSSFLVDYVSPTIKVAASEGTRVEGRKLSCEYSFTHTTTRGSWTFDAGVIRAS